MMENDNISESPNRPTEKKMINAWSIFAFLVGSYLFVVGIMMDKDPPFMLFGLSIMTGATYVGYMRYLGKRILSDKVQQSLAASGSVILKLVFTFGVVGVSIQIFFGATAEQERFAKAAKIDASDFIRYSCQTKSTCKTYAEVRLSCAQAGNIDRCIDIKMQSRDYSSCTYDGNIGGFDEKLMPNSAQCAGSSILSFLAR